MIFPLQFNPRGFRIISDMGTERVGRPPAYTVEYGYQMIGQLIPGKDRYQFHTPRPIIVDRVTMQSVLDVMRVLDDILALQT